MSFHDKPYGTTVLYLGYYNKSKKEGKLHKRHKQWPKYAKCGSAGLSKFYETTEGFTTEDLCGKCFKKKLIKRQEFINSFLLPEELFEI